MPTFNRRGFLQILGAAGAAPLLPALPGRAVAGASGVSASKALWAGIYAKSGSVPQFLNVARGMGLPDAAIRGVGARSVGVRVSAAAIGRSVSGGSGVQAASSGEGLRGARELVRDFLEEVEDEVVPEVEDADADDALSGPESSRRRRANT